MYALIFHNVGVLDGTGRPAIKAYVAVEGDRIARLGDLAGVAARRVIDGRGTVLAPGFIDLHTHCDFTLPQFPAAEAMVRQGVTTLVTGNCGFSPFPVHQATLDQLRASCAFFGGELSWEWQTASQFMDHLERLPLGVNVAPLVGHGAVRTTVMGHDDRQTTPQELAAMVRLVEEAMVAGAFGLSTGLIYPPGTFSTTDELVALARVVSRWGGYYTSHVRGEADTLVEAVQEAVAIGRQADLPVQLSHHKAMGQRNRGRVATTLEMIDAAQAEGLDVTADQYPYTAASTTLAALVPRWALEGGVERLQQRLADPQLWARLVAEITATPTGPTQPTARDFTPEAIMISAVPAGPNRQYEGLMLSEIAVRRGEQPAETVLKLLQRDGGTVQMVGFTMAEEDVQRVMRHPAVAVASDGWTLSPLALGKPHPRSYGTFVRVLGRYVREERALSLEEAVRKMTALPARRLGRNDLGVIRPGALANLVGFDPASVGDRATYEDPHQFGAGVRHVMVNGQLVVENGEMTEARPGRLLRRGQR